ncbi:chemotaxis protein CheY [Kosmotoga arenicorallina S304]|uniref:Chemotaxis protein CheY n=1 Tax=Kosmotoga arenicorallina S304 TaxID=1453497 RepID=A0A176K1Z2_9BACT|nr:response regulator [Kosmotoga arenicorallina]OAA31019.1 chemotaxis protein CheY [Kosmotoga arenicorallina S304]
MPKILLVDDSPITRKFHSYILKSAGFEVFEAGDGGEALDLLFFHGDFDCLITDLNMPGMDGVTMIKKIRESEAFEELPIIVITTLDRPEDKRKGIEAGADFYIVKPVDPEMLVESTKLALGE